MTGGDPDLSAAMRRALLKHREVAPEEAPEEWGRYRLDKCHYSVLTALAQRGLVRRVVREYRLTQRGEALVTELRAHGET